MSVYPMFGVSYFCVPIFVSSYLYVTLKMGKLRVSLAELCRESQITQTGEKIETDKDTFLSPESIRLEIEEKEPKIQTVQNEDFIFWTRVKVLRTLRGALV